MHHVICTIKFTFFAEDGSSIESTLVGEALDTGDKATNKAMAIAYKYACFQVFCIPTSDMTDPDAESVSGMQPAGNPPQSQQTGTPPAADMRTSKINGEMIRRLQGELARTGVQESQINDTFKVGKITDLTVEQYNKAMRRLQKTLAAIIFVVIAVLTFVTSSFWGIEAVAVSIVVPLAIALDANVLLALGAVVSGGVFGSHACFYSDATVLSSATCEIDNMSHAVSQFPYVLISAAFAVAGFLICGIFAL